MNFKKVWFSFSFCFLASFQVKALEFPSPISCKDESGYVQVLAIQLETGAIETTDFHVKISMLGQSILANTLEVVSYIKGVITLVGENSSKSEKYTLVFGLADNESSFRVQEIQNGEISREEVIPLTCH